jgi:hypothetical protein
VAHQPFGDGGFRRPALGQASNEEAHNGEGNGQDAGDDAAASRPTKLTAARAISVRKKRDGQGLLFHRRELDRWLEQEYPSTRCAG